jgi:DNA-binding MarR family transcriptional regulator
VSTPNSRQTERATLLKELARVGREHSDATVLFHMVVAERLGLNPTDEKAMSILQRLGPLSAGDIAEHTGLATASVTDLIDRLEKRGFVRRVRDPADRRRVMVEPSAARVAEAEPLFRATAASLARLLEGFSTEELRIITEFMQRNAERLRSETARLERERQAESGKRFK